MTIVTCGILLSLACNKLLQDCPLVQYTSLSYRLFRIDILKRNMLLLCVFTSSQESKPLFFGMDVTNAAMCLEPLTDNLDNANAL